MKEGKRSEKFEMITLHKLMFLIFSVAIIYKYLNTTTPVTVHIEEPKFSLNGPFNYNATKTQINDDYEKLIDISNFKFLANPQPCRDYTSGLLLMIIVSSHPNNTKNRMVIRNTWGRNLDSTKLVFLLGESQNSIVTQEIKKEINEYGDIVQGNFIDAYRNLTYKHVMGLKWVNHHCHLAKYILKTDDDILVNTRALRHFLARGLSPWGAQDLIACQVFEHAEAFRSNSSKWKVTTAEYADLYYPTYCAGWAVLYSQDVIPRLLEAVQSSPYFWIDDVQITGVAAEKMDVPRTNFKSLMLSNFRLKMLNILGSGYIKPFIFLSPSFSVNKIEDIWKALPEEMNLSK